MCLVIRRQMVPGDIAVDILRGRTCPRNPIPNRNDMGFLRTAIGARICSKHILAWIKGSIGSMHGTGPTVRMENMHALKTTTNLARLELARTNGTRVVVMEENGRWRRGRR